MFFIRMHLVRNAEKKIGQLRFCFLRSKVIVTKIVLIVQFTCFTVTRYENLCQHFNFNKLGRLKITQCKYS